MNFKRILAVVLLLLLAVAPVTAMAAYYGDRVAQVSKSDYKPRITAPSGSNSYYYSNMNIFYSIGYGMPNCTAYAWGRAYELLGTQPKLSLDSAHYWYDYNKDHNYYPSGKTPKLGAIACWDNPYGGHVAVVEKITDTTVTLSHSEWGGRTFFLTEHEISAANGGALSSGWTFDGYIYILDGEILPDGDIYAVDSSNGINMRKKAGTDSETLIAVPDKTELVVTKTKVADGYTWGKTTYAGFTGWCALDYCVLVYKLPEPTTVPPETEASLDETPVTEPPATEPADTTEPPATEPAETEPPEATEPAETQPEVTAPVLQANPNAWGDVTGDSKTSVADATALQKYLASMDIIIDLEKADINGDDKVSVADATYIQKILAGIGVQENISPASFAFDVIN